MKRSAAVSVAYGFGVALLGAGRRLRSPWPGPRPIRQSHAVRSGRRRPRRSGQAGGRQRHGPTIAPSDVSTAIKFCKAAAASSPRALYELGRAYAANQQLPDAIGAYARRPTRPARPPWSSSAWCCERAGVAKDEAQARPLFERAADAGNPRRDQSHGDVTGARPSDPVKARALLTQAAQTNSAGGAVSARNDDRRGRRRPERRRRGAGLVREGGGTSHPGALERMGAFAESGRGGPKDRAPPKPITSAPRPSATTTPRSRSSAANVRSSLKTSAATPGDHPLLLSGGLVNGRDTRQARDLHAAGRRQAPRRRTELKLLLHGVGKVRRLSERQAATSFRGPPTSI